jgi:hypothetical protein
MADGETRTGERTVRAEINYFKSSLGKPAFGAPRGSANSWETEKRLMTIHDASSWADPPRLDREGITLYPFKTAVTDFRDRDQLRTTYVGELEELMRQATGATYAVGFAGANMRFSQRRPEEVGGLSRPAPLAHVDVTARTAPGIGHNPIFPKEPEVLKPGQRLVGYNVWRVVSDPPHDIPLAVCDQRTVERADLVEADGVYGTGAQQFRSEAYLVRHNPAHRWIYFRDMTPGDALIFRAYETSDAGPSPVPHAAFTDPSCPETAPGRISVEARVYVVFDE